ncbi:uracil-DNA glycosylase family protein [Novosphingobium mangrovi (ex Huang et al. 2023)]|uniref:Uracil-DNA glycosylase family protein n=1 Tax=Novosphingobium mangrovi (ex Huang et al. 2023) TaxID=2976432 RepID=A0ABT2HZR7_9SPHN|nr:uracil-DNA glycosylase family protein [Novosphingobium mangrovi (ex Huang et al. 2023)]MCT2398045.1 uracil-DNA glycosylase family protein [Novosphingobium mangrovi (ex Huang et al. 2023)]
MAAALNTLLEDIRACRLCEATLPHDPRPVVQAGEGARVLVIGQAPGSKVHASGKAWDDDSGDRLREWTGLSSEEFYDPASVAHMPSGFCYPGKGNGGDLPPRPECAPRWHAPLRTVLPNVRLTLLVGQYAQKRYLPRGFAANLTEAVRRWREAPEGTIPLPHPAWRSRLWMAKHPWFEAELLPDLRERVRAALQKV